MFGPVKLRLPLPSLRRKAEHLSSGAVSGMRRERVFSDLDRTVGLKSDSPSDPSKRRLGVVMPAVRVP